MAMEGRMRVSVVATGIDAVEIPNSVPVPRRLMSAPLKQSVSVEELRPAPLELDAPVETPQVADVTAVEPSLFEGMDVEQAAAQDQAEDIFEEPEELTQDGLPMPAYQPQVAEFQPQAEVAETQAESFVAPKAPAPGTPSPEAIVRLQAAAQRVSPAAVPDEPVQHTSKQRGGFGLNSLINRMTGQVGDTPAATQQLSQRQQPAMQQQAPAPQQEVNPDQERIEIPAFLRRQAN